MGSDPFKRRKNRRSTIQKPGLTRFGLEVDCGRSALGKTPLNSQE
jgi:hypothetical protein